jgi:hypothetical protein
LINAAVEHAASPINSDHRALVVDSCLRGPLSWRGAAIISNVDTAQPIELAQDAVLDQLPLEQGFVTRIFGLHDDPKRGWISPRDFQNQGGPIGWQNRRQVCGPMAAAAHLVECIPISDCPIATMV